MKCGAGLANDAVFDVEDDFTLNQEMVIENQRILGEIDGAFDGVFDGHESCVHLATFDGIQHIGNGAIGNALKCGKISLREECLLRERASGTEISDALRLGSHAVRLGLAVMTCALPCTKGPQ